MEKTDIGELRARVGCAAVLEHEGFAIDRKESTRRAVKFRRNDDIIIVIHDDRGRFDARSDAKGDVFALASYLHGVGFAEVLKMNRISDRLGPSHANSRLLPRGPPRPA